MTAVAETEQAPVATQAQPRTARAGQSQPGESARARAVSLVAPGRVPVTSACVADTPLSRTLAAVVQGRASGAFAAAGQPGALAPRAPAPRATGAPVLHRTLKVKPGLQLDTRGVAVTQVGNVYKGRRVTHGSLENEVFSALLASPREFTIDGDTNQAVEANLAKHIFARLGIVDFASKKRYKFGAGASFRMNPKYWVVSPQGIGVKPGVDPQKAMDDLNVEPDAYVIACLAATLLTMQGGSRSTLRTDQSTDTKDWVPGDWGYVRNTKFPPGGTVGLEGENLIYAGSGKFWGHFTATNEYKALQEWCDQVKGWHGGADIDSARTRPTIGLK